MFQSKVIAIKAEIVSYPRGIIEINDNSCTLKQYLNIFWSALPRVAGASLLASTRPVLFLFYFCAGFSWRFLFGFVPVAPVLPLLRLWPGWHWAWKCVYSPQFPPCLPLPLAYSEMLVGAASACHKIAESVHGDANKLPCVRRWWQGAILPPSSATLSPSTFRNRHRHHHSRLGAIVVHVFVICRLVGCKEC